MAGQRPRLRSLLREQGRPGRSRPSVMAAVHAVREVLIARRETHSTTSRTRSGRRAYGALSSRCLLAQTMPIRCLPTICSACETSASWVATAGGDHEPDLSRGDPAEPDLHHADDDIRRPGSGVVRRCRRGVAGGRAAGGVSNVLREHSAHWVERCGYTEAGPQLPRQAFLQRIVAVAESNASTVRAAWASISWWCGCGRRRRRR